MNRPTDISKIVEALHSHDEKNEIVPVEQLREWMHRPEIEVQAAIYDLVTSAERLKKVVPDMKFEDHLAFMPSFLSRCIIEDPDSEIALSRWEAAMELMGWFGSLWDNSSVNKSVLSGVKDQIRKLYLQGDADVRKAVVQGTLEHLFENASIRDFFADWLDDPTLQRAFQAAAEWSKFGGHTPVSPKSSRT